MTTKALIIYEMKRDIISGKLFSFWPKIPEIIFFGPDFGDKVIKGNVQMIVKKTSIIIRLLCAIFLVNLICFSQLFTSRMALI